MPNDRLLVDDWPCPTETELKHPHGLSADSRVNGVIASSLLAEGASFGIEIEGK
jgi:hypothetical protein